MKKILTLLFTCLMGTLGAWAEETLVYGRALAADVDAGIVAWSSADVGSTAWNGNAGYDETYGIYMSGSGNRTTTQTFTITENSKLIIDIAWNTLNNTGNASNYSYINIGENIAIQSNQQNQNGSVIINGTSYAISNANGKNNGNRNNDIWNIHVEINTANSSLDALTVTGTLGTSIASYSLASAITLNSSISGSVAVTMGTVRAGGTPATAMQAISIYEEAQEVSTMGYTINYLYGDNNIKQVTNTTAVGAIVNAENPITINDVRYFAAEGATTSLTVTDNADNNVLNVDLRLPYTFNYTVNAIDGSNNILETLSSGTYTEGDDAISLNYPRYILSGTTLYASGTGAVSYNTTFTPDADDYVKNITFNSGTVTDVVYYTEGEDVSGVSVGSNVRASVGKMGYTGGSENYVDVTTIASGKYKIYLRGQNGNSAARAFNFKVGDEVVFTGAITNGTNVDSNSDEFNVAVASTLSYASEGSSQSGVDYFYLVRTADLTEQISINSTGASSYVTTYALDFSDVEGLTALVATEETETKIVMTKVTEVPAGTPIILRGTPNETYTVPVGTCTELPVEKNLLSGSVTEEKSAGDFSTTVYALMNTDGAFHPVAATVTIPAKIAYLVSSFSSTTGAKAISIFGEEDTPTAITATKDETENVTVRLYNTAGQQVDKNYQGVVIDENGKKYIK